MIGHTKGRTRLGANQRCALAGALTGLAIALVALDPGFIAGSGGRWTRPDNDLVSYVVALNYFTIDRWRFPLFDLPSMGYPEGTNLGLNDSLPLAALPAKVLFHVTGVRVNPFGAWMLLTYILQGVMAARLVRSLGAGTVWASVAAASFAVVNTFFLYRIIHTALSGQFLILWALAVHFESVDRGRVGRWEVFGLLTVAFFVNPYLCAMVAASVTATLGTLALRHQLSWRDVGVLAAGGLAIAAMGIASGYGVAVSQRNSMVGLGYGFYSWNLVTLLWPPGGVFGFFANVPRDMTGGQYEGDAYLGIGAMALLAAWVVAEPRRTLAFLRRHWLLTAAVGALAVLAASNRFYVGGTLVASFDLSPRALQAMSFFRSNGRFIWPLAYCLALLPLAGVCRHWRAAPAMIAVALAVTLQLVEAAPLVRSVRARTSAPAADLIEEPRMDTWLRQHDKVWQFPSFWCGGLEPSTRRWGNAESNRELQIQLAASRAGIAINSVYTSRWWKDCRAEERWAAAPRIDDGVLYLLSFDAIERSAALEEIARSPACERLRRWVVCSSRSLP